MIPAQLHSPTNLQNMNASIVQMKDSTNKQELNGKPDYFILELFCLSPFSNTSETEAVVAIWQDTKSPLTWRLLHHHFKAHSTCFVFGSCHCKGQLHILLMLSDALLKHQIQYSSYATCVSGMWYAASPKYISQYRLLVINNSSLWASVRTKVSYCLANKIFSCPLFVSLALTYDTKTDQFHTSECSVYKHNLLNCCQQV